MSNEGLLKRFRELLALYHQVNQTFLMKGHQVIEPDMLATLKARQRLAWEIIREPLDAFLREQHEGKNNLVVFCSDHGDNFGDQDWTYHFANVTDGGNRVPLYWLPPGESRPRTESTNVGARYLYHELLRAAGGNADGPSLLQEPEQCLPLIESYWYNKRGKTLPKYHYNQFCFLNDSTRYVLRNDRWLHAPVGPTGPAEPVFEPLDPNIDPIQEVADAEQRQYLQSRMREFSEFSRKVLP
jgi:arylsulfatase A-like enzyme